MNAIDLDFLSWFEMVALFPDDLYAELVSMGIERSLAREMAYSEAIRKHRSIITLWRDFGSSCEHGKPYRDAIHALIDRYMLLWDKLKNK